MLPRCTSLETTRVTWSSTTRSSSRWTRWIGFSPWQIPSPYLAELAYFPLLSYLLSLSLSFSLSLPFDRTVHSVLEGGISSDDAGCEEGRELFVKYHFFLPLKLGVRFLPFARKRKTAQPEHRVMNGQTHAQKRKMQTLLRALVFPPFWMALVAKRD